MNRKEELKKKFKPLRFGTSGLRALVADMTDMECYINTRGFLRFLKSQGEIKAGAEETGAKVAVAGDLRSSTSRIITAVVKAVQDEDCTAELCGHVPTPTLMNYAVKAGMPSIMVTGSHIPDDRNGIKFTKLSGEILKSDETGILKNVADARGDEYGRSREASLFDDTGMFKEKPQLPSGTFEKEAVEQYIDRYTSVFSNKPFTGRKIFLYQHSAVGRDIIKEIFESLGAEVATVGRSDDFVPVDTEKVSGETRTLLHKIARKNRPFAIISTDGDSDRPLLADENGDFLPGDKLGALVSVFLRPDFAAVPISANDGVINVLKGKGILVEQTRIGSPYVIKAMKDELEKDPKAKVAGWESNGGFLLGSDWTIDGKALKALPTRDAVLPLISALLLAVEKNKPVSEIIAELLPARFTSAGVVDNKMKSCEKYTADLGKAIIKMFSPEDSSVKQAVFTKEGIDVDGKEADRDLADELNKIKQELGKYFSKERQFGEVVSINFIDGIRIVFDNGDVAHIRPSGNAPEFRMYVTSDTQEKADSILSKKTEIVSSIIKDVDR